MMWKDGKMEDGWENGKKWKEEDIKYGDDEVESVTSGLPVEGVTLKS